MRTILRVWEGKFGGFQRTCTWRRRCEAGSEKTSAHQRCLHRNCVDHGDLLWIPDTDAVPHWAVGRIGVPRLLHERLKRGFLVAMFHPPQGPGQDQGPAFLSRSRTLDFEQALASFDEITFIADRTLVMHRNW